MPSRFRIRESLGLKPKLDETQQSCAVSPAPARAPSPALAGTTIRVADNVAFELALQRYVEKLDRAERTAFENAYQNISIEDLFAKIKEFDDAHNRKSTSRRCAEPITRFLTILDQFMGGVANGVQSSAEISALVGAVRIVIDTAVEFVTFFARLTDMMIRLSDHLEHLAEYVKASHETKLIQTAEEARLVFVDEQGAERKWTSIRIFIRSQWEPFETRFGTIDSNLRHHLEVLLHSAQALQLRDIDLERRRVRQKERVEERRQFLRWLSEINFEDDHEKIYAKRHPGTGKWFTQEGKFKQWFGDDGSSVLWCFGRPGAGKSVLASIVLEHITTTHGLNDKIGVAFVYHKYDSLESQEPSQIISAFIKQLCWKKEQIPQHLLDFYRTYDQDVRIPAFDVYKVNFFHLAKYFDQLFVVVDALDECKQDEQDGVLNREQMMDFIFELTDNLPCAKVFVTSRRETDIIDAFTRHKVPTIQIEANNVAGDIKTYVSDRVEHLVKVKKLKLGKPALEEKIVEALVAGAEGMFLWVNLQLLNICKQRSDQDIEAELHNMPRGLDRTYARILQQIQQHPTALRELARRCLVWVTYAARPLHARELLDAVQIGESTEQRGNLPRYDEEAVTEACANLIEMNYGFVRPIHHSVKEFLTSPESSSQLESTLQEGPREFFVNTTMAHTMLSCFCLAYLLQGFLDSGPCKDFINLYRRVQAYRLAPYSSYFFDSHLRQLSEVPDEARKLLKRFLSSKNAAFAAVMQLRALGGRGCELFAVGSLFTAMLPEVDASTVIRSTALMDHSDLHDDIDGLLLKSAPKYIMHQAASAELLSYVTQLIQEGYKVDERDHENKTPLFHSSRNGHRETSYYLLKCGATVEARSNRGETPLHAAAFGGHEAVVRLLIEDYKADIEAIAGDDMTVLHKSALGGNEAVVRILIERYKADIEAKTSRGVTLLQAAALGGNEAVVRMLIEDYKADIEAKTTDDNMAVIHAAAAGGNRAMMRMLVGEYKADVNAKTSNGRTALHLAALTGNEEMARMLIEDCKADVDAKTTGGDTVLHTAAVGGNEAVVRILVQDYKADIEARTTDDRAVIHEAAAGGNAEMMRMLVDEYGADINVKTGEGKTVLHVAAENGCEAVVQVLLEHKTDVDIKTSEHGWTALYKAAEKGHEAVVRLLLEHKADANAEAIGGKTALQAAAEKGHEAVVQLLRSAGQCNQPSDSPP